MIFKTKISSLNFRGLMTYASAACLLLFTSCQKEIGSTLIDDGSLQINFNGVQDYEASNINAKLASTQINKEETTSKIVSYNGFDAITTVDILDSQESNGLQKEALAKRSSSVIQGTKLADSVSYRLVFFDIKDNSVAVDEIIAANGTAPRIRLETGKEYKWVAYSINESYVPSFDATNKTIAKEEIANKDFLFASNTITIQPKDNFLNLTLKRYTTAYEVTIDVRGMFATFHEETKVSLVRVDTTNKKDIANDLFQTANFNLIDGEFVGTPQALNISAAQLQTTPAGVNDIKVARFFSIPNQMSNTELFSVKFDTLTLLMDDQTKRGFKNSIVKINHKPVTFTSTRGRKIALKAQLVESGIKVGNDTTTVWARSNLWYSEGNNTGEYRFRVSPHFRDLVNKKYSESLFKLTDPNDMWKFGASTPSGDPNDDVDPCTKVLPLNLWMTPTKAMFDNLPDRSDSVYVIDRGEPQFPGALSILFPVKYFEYVFRWKSSTPSDDAYKERYRNNDPNSTMEDLFLPALGYKQADGTTHTETPSYTALVSLSPGVDVLTAVGGMGGGGFYWYRTTGEDSGSYADYYKVQYTRASIASLNLGIVNLNLGGTNNVSSFTLPSFDKDYRLSIRCVRNKNFPKAPIYSE